MKEKKVIDFATIVYQIETNTKTMLKIELTFAFRTFCIDKFPFPFEIFSYILSSKVAFPKSIEFARVDIFLREWTL